MDELPMPEWQCLCRQALRRFAFWEEVDVSAAAKPADGAELVACLATAMALLFLLAGLATGWVARALEPRLGRVSGGAG